MQTSTEELPPWDYIIDELDILSGIANANGSFVSLKDLAALTRTNLSEEEISSSWESIPDLVASYELKNGLFIKRDSQNPKSTLTAVARELHKKARAERYSHFARVFASFCDYRSTALVAISGSTSYKTPDASDDLDMFCVTKPGQLWLFITKSLLLARFLRLFRKDFPRICLSYAVDQSFAEKEFPLHQDAIFARDALTTEVIRGENYYKSLLRNSSWISGYFPRLYQQRVADDNRKFDKQEERIPSPGAVFINTLLRAIVGNYISLKSAMLNRRLRKRGDKLSLFSAKIGSDHCIFESTRYASLGAMYRKLSTLRPTDTIQPRGGEPSTLSPATPRGLVQSQTLRLITTGRVTGLPHVVELRYVHLGNSFFVLSTNADGDWIRNALRSIACRIKIGEIVQQVQAHIASPEETSRVLDSYREKYGSRVVDHWYKGIRICLRLEPSSSFSIRRAVRGENETLVTFPIWKSREQDYLQSLTDAFNSAAEEYDYTIGHNYINTWIRKRSINELRKLAREDDVLLEIGCGTGAEAIQVSKQVQGVIATDISERMLDILARKVKAKRLDHKILPNKVRAAHISQVRKLLPNGARIAYSFNGALNCEPDIDKIPGELAKIIQPNGYFVCSIRNTLCLTESLSHSLVFQFERASKRKHQPTMVSVGGMDIPSTYYSPLRFASIFGSHFKVRKIIGLPALLPPAYLSDRYIRIGRLRPILEKLEAVLSSHFPFNRLGDQTLFVFQKT